MTDDLDVDPVSDRPRIDVGLVRRWARGRGWALWKALITYAQARDTEPAKATDARRVLDEIFAEDAQFTR